MLYAFLVNHGRPFHFSRTIRDALTRAEFVARGRAAWSPVDAGAADELALAQTEEGSLEGTGAAVRASYTWHFGAAAAGGGSAAASIRFPDSRVFVERLDLSAGACDVTHFCDPDTYEGTFSLECGVMRVTWSVRGPQKDYVSTTEFTPT